MKREQRLSKIYYSPDGYWKGLVAITRLAQAVKVSDEVARSWLRKQALWQVFLPSPRYIPRPKFDVPVPNEVHQADLLFMPHDRVGGTLWKYALTVVDIGSRFRETEPLSTKDSREIASAFEKIYERGPLEWQQLLQIDPGREFMGAVSRVMKEHCTSIRRGQPNLHRNQGLVERFNRTLAENLSRHQYAVEMRLPEGERSVAWVRRLPRVVAAINNQVTRLRRLKPIDAIKKFLGVRGTSHGSLSETGRFGRKNDPLGDACSLSLSQS